MFVCSRRCLGDGFTVAHVTQTHTDREGRATWQRCWGAIWGFQALVNWEPSLLIRRLGVSEHGSHKPAHTQREGKGAVCVCVFNETKHVWNMPLCSTNTRQEERVNVYLIRSKLIDLDCVLVLFKLEICQVDWIDLRVPTSPPIKRSFVGLCWLQVAGLAKNGLTSLAMTV